MRRLILCLLVAVAAGVLLYGWGYRQGAASVAIVESVQTVPVYYEKPEPVRVSHSTAAVRVPLLLFAPADTVRQTVVVPVGQHGFGCEDTPDSVELHFDIERLEYGGRDTTFFAVVSGPTVGGLGPRLDKLELYAAERIRTSVIHKPYRWEIGPAAGAWRSPAGSGIWIGAHARYNLGRLHLSAAAGYDTHNDGPFGQVKVGVAVWRITK
ncbi:DUF6808 domain-containing protein [Alistipes sp.]|uniref:DUF6808 domain-containing protein n=1 Tax=Alistipes sp. TaxID=1872444 RepID=UPI003AEF46CA